MLSLLSGISVTCFVGSYLVALGLELTRPFFRLPARVTITAGVTIAGLAAHLVFLITRAFPQGLPGDIGLWAGWYDWSLLLAWGLAACYLVLFLRRPETTVGYFLLPPVLGLVALAMAVRDWTPFSRAEAFGFWRSVHALAMLVGAVVVLLGFVAGIMYLVQSTRLKHKRAGSRSLRLPTLEWLQQLNRRCLLVSTAVLALGLISGAVMNLNRWGHVGWTERGVILSGILLLWLIAATLFEFFYKPARQGRKIAYLTLASFGFLVLAMVGVLSSPHGRAAADSASGPGIDAPGEEPSPRAAGVGAAAGRRS